MKKPDEIKKGLMECNRLEPECVDCPYGWEEGLCDKVLKRDALAYIQQLERERDALLDIVRKEADCQLCKHSNPDCDGDCSFCEMEPCACFECTTDNIHWEWAGIKEDTE